MNYEPPQKGFKTFLILVFLGLGTFAVARVGKTALILFTSANVTQKPGHVRITNVTATALTVSWHTEIPTTGYLTLTNNNQQWEDFSPYLATNHHLTIDGLQPNTVYEVLIGVGKQQYEISKTSMIKTAFKNNLGEPHRVFGQVIDITNEPVENALVYLVIKDADAQGTSGISSQLSAITNPEGIYSINLQDALTNNWLGPFFYSHETDQLEISAIGVNEETASIIINTKQSQPSPTIKLTPQGRIEDLTKQDLVKGININLGVVQKRDSAAKVWLRKQLLKLAVL